MCCRSSQEGRDWPNDRYRWSDGCCWARIPHREKGVLISIGRDQDASLMQVLKERNFPYNDIKLLASARLVKFD